MRLPSILVLLIAVAGKLIASSVSASTDPRQTKTALVTSSDNLFDGRLLVSEGRHAHGNRILRVDSTAATKDNSIKVSNEEERGISKALQKVDDFIMQLKLKWWLSQDLNPGQIIKKLGMKSSADTQAKYFKYYAVYGEMWQKKPVMGPVIPYRGHYYGRNSCPLSAF